jgi:predicted lipoprotein with Yx(FWY)xxD motif
MLAVGGMAVALAVTGCAGNAGNQKSNNVANDGPLPAEAPAATTGAPAAPAQAPGAPVVNGPASLIKKNIPKMGSVVTDKDGRVMYRFDKDSKSPAKSNCDGTCAKVWPPVLTLGIPVVDGVDPTLVDTVVRTDGTMQVTIGGWPVYTYIGDKKPLAWTGQGVAGTWWVIAPDGKKNLTCVPTATPKAVPPPADDAQPTASPTDGGGGGNGSGY